MKISCNSAYTFTNPDNGAILTGQALEHAEVTPWLKMQIEAGVYTDLDAEEKKAEAPKPEAKK